MAKGSGGGGRSGRLSSSQRSQIDGMFKYSSGAARYAKNSVAVSAPAPAGDVRMTLAGRVAQDSGGRYSNRERAWIMSKSQFKKFQANIQSERQSTRDMWRRRNREGV